MQWLLLPLANLLRNRSVEGGDPSRATLEGEGTRGRLGSRAGQRCPVAGRR